MIRKLFTRVLLIVIVPILILQLIIAYIFYVRHWENVSNRMEEALIGEVLLVLRSVESEHNFAKLADKAKLLGLDIKLNNPDDQFLQHNSDNSTDNFKTDYYLVNFIKNLRRYYDSPVKAGYMNNFSNIRLSFETRIGVLQIDVSSKRIYSPTTYIFILWMVGASTLLMLLSILFMKNQVRSVLKLADAAERLGKGQDVNDFKPSGAEEIRVAGKAFLLMKRRINRQIYYRSQMLAHISHDLRTPLTRVRLNTEFIKERQIAEEINTDIARMEQLIGEYLNFAKEEGNEPSHKFDLIKLVAAVIKRYNDPKISFGKNADICIVHLKEYAIERAIVNLIDNAIRYAKSKIEVSVAVKKHHCYIHVDDDGLGIAKRYYKKVFKPFYKIDGNTKGFGLGLAIVKSIIYGHGGKIKLSQSLLGGLRITIKIPL